MIGRDGQRFDFMADSLCLGENEPSDDFLLLRIKPNSR